MLRLLIARSSSGGGRQRGVRAQAVRGKIICYDMFHADPEEIYARD